MSCRDNSGDRHQISMQLTQTCQKIEWNTFDLTQEDAGKQLWHVVTVNRKRPRLTRRTPRNQAADTLNLWRSRCPVPSHLWKGPHDADGRQPAICPTNSMGSIPSNGVCWYIKIRKSSIFGGSFYCHIWLLGGYISNGRLEKKTRIWKFGSKLHGIFMVYGHPIGILK